MENSNKISEVTEAFNLPGELKECIPYGNGHINDTYRLTCETPEGIRRYILQRMSRRIFKNPQELMDDPEDEEELESVLPCWKLAQYFKDKLPEQATVPFDLG